MSDHHGSYTAAERADFDPGPCPRCGERNSRVNWVQVTISVLQPYDDTWMPGTVECLNPACSSRARYGPELCERWYSPVSDRVHDRPAVAGLVNPAERPPGLTLWEWVLLHVLHVCQGLGVEPHGTLTFYGLTALWSDDKGIRWGATPRLSARGTPCPTVPSRCAQRQAAPS